MKIDVSKNPVVKDEFNLNFLDCSFVASRGGVFINVTRDELIKLAAFANAELQDAEVTRG